MHCTIRGPAGKVTRRADTGQIATMFDRIAARYDLVNRLMTAGMDGRWRRETVAALALRPGRQDIVLDLGCGTGDLALGLQSAGARSVVGADPAAAMLKIGVKKAPRLAPVLADAQRLPFRDGAFDAVGTAFTVRNIEALPFALAEVRRVLRPGGRFAILDLTRPRPTLLARLFRLYTGRVLPVLGGLVSGDAAAYRYLPASVERFLSAEELRTALLEAGFARVSTRRLAPGEVSLMLANA